MNYLLYTGVALLFSFRMLGFAADSPDPVRFEVSVGQVRSEAGFVVVVVYNNPMHFLQYGSDKIFSLSVKKATVGKMSFPLTLPQGSYGFLAYHDENENQKLDIGVLGIPKEGFGFSKNPMIWRSPKFNECEIFVAPANQSIEIKLRHI